VKLGDQLEAARAICFSGAAGIYVQEQEWKRLVWCLKRAFSAAFDGM
jgi:hypothetical protein